MKTNNTVNAEQIMKGYRQVYRELYTLAFCITGSERGASGTLMNVMIANPAYPGKKTAFSLVKQEALQVGSDAECRACDCFEEEGPLCNETDEVRAAAFLVCGLGLSPSKAARILHEKTSAVKKYAARAMEKAGGPEGRKAIRQMTAAYLKQGDAVPDEATFMRALENRISERREAASAVPTGKKLTFMLIWVVIQNLILLAILGGLIWTGTILLDYVRQMNRANVTEPAEETDAPIQWND